MKMLVTVLTDGDSTDIQQQQCQTAIALTFGKNNDPR